MMVFSDSSAIVVVSWKRWRSATQQLYARATPGAASLSATMVSPLFPEAGRRAGTSNYTGDMGELGGDERSGAGS
jgi:hypothetical protein